MVRHLWRSLLLILLLIHPWMQLCTGTCTRYSRPLSPSATPRTKKDFENTTDDAFKHYSDLIHCHPSGIREVDNKIQWDEPEGPETKVKLKDCTFSFMLQQHVDFIFLDSRKSGTSRRWS